MFQLPLSGMSTYSKTRFENGIKRSGTMIEKVNRRNAFARLLALHISISLTFCGGLRVKKRTEYANITSGAPKKMRKIAILII